MVNYVVILLSRKSGITEYLHLFMSGMHSTQVIPFPLRLCLCKYYYVKAELKKIRHKTAEFDNHIETKVFL